MNTLITKGDTTVDKWNQAMENAFQPASGYSNAAGMRKTCGAKPTHLRYPNRKNFNTAMDSYLKCVDEVRQMNLSAGLPPDTGIPQPTQNTAPAPNTNGIPVPDMTTTDQTAKTGMSQPLKWGLIAGGTALTLTALYFGVKHFRKAAPAA